MMRCRLAPRIAATSTLFAFAFPQKRFNRSTSGDNAPPLQPPPSAVSHGTTPRAPEHTTTGSLPIKDLASRYGRCIVEGETLSPWALHHVVSSRDSNVADVELLIRHGADVNAKWGVSGWNSSRTPLYLAADRGDADAVKFLLENGAKVNAVLDRSRETPLHAATKCASVATVKLLVDHGANVNAKVRHGFSTPLHLAAHHSRLSEGVAITKLLIASGADVDIKDEYGQTPLHQAAMGMSGQRIKVLVDAGADLNALDKKSRTPLHIAATVRGGATARALIDAGANPNLPDSKSYTPLHVVAALHGGATAHAIVDGILALKAREAQSKGAAVKAGGRSKAKGKTPAAAGRAKKAKAPAEGSKFMFKYRYT